MHHSAHMNLLPQSSLQESLEHLPKIILNNFFLVLKSKLKCFYWYGNYLPHEISFGLFFIFFVVTFFRSSTKPSGGSFVFGQNMSDRVMVRKLTNALNQSHTN